MLSKVLFRNNANGLFRLELYTPEEPNVLKQVQAKVNGDSQVQKAKWPAIQHTQSESKGAAHAR